MAKRTTPRAVRNRIVAAIHDGFGGHVVKEDLGDGTIVLRVDGAADPIKVWDGGMDVPSSFHPAVVAGIRLDVQTIQAGY